MNVTHRTTNRATDILGTRARLLSVSLFCHRSRADSSMVRSKDTYMTYLYLVRAKSDVKDD
jgi:hypothetical protein